MDLTQWTKGEHINWLGQIKEDTQRDKLNTKTSNIMQSKSNYGQILPSVTWWTWHGHGTCADTAQVSATPLLKGRKGLPLTLRPGLCVSGVCANPTFSSSSPLIFSDLHLSLCVSSSQLNIHNNTNHPIPPALQNHSYKKKICTLYVYYTRQTSSNNTSLPLFPAGGDQTEGEASAVQAAEGSNSPAPTEGRG